jgi:hypothetical protein
MWTYKQTTGRFVSDPSASTAISATGYSGHGDGMNNPQMQAVKGQGPLPLGSYTIGDPLDPPDHLGPLAMPLTPDVGNCMFGRSAFFIHGDNPALDHTASDGCVILDHPTRAAIAASADRRLRVIT